MRKINYFLSILFVFLFSGVFSQDAAYTMTATTKTITSCRSSLDMELACSSAGKSVYCANLDRSYTFLSSSGGILNANLTLHILDDDFIYVYDGPSSASPLIATWTGGTTTDFVTGLNATSTGSVLTIRFVSNGSKGITYNAGGGSYYSGWSILVGCAPSNCNGNTPANDNCSAAPQICNLTGYCGNTSGWYNEDNGQLEGQVAPGFGGSIENNSWINFVSSATTATLVVKSANCLFSGSGIQGAVYASTNCSTFTPVSGGNFNQTLAAGNATLNLTGLTAGQDYYLMLDGYGGNVCDYTVTAIGNVQTYSVSTSAASNTICPNQTFTVTATAGATSYSWNPAPASTSSNTAVYNNISSSSVITTTAFGYCGASAVASVSMTVQSLSVTVPTATNCAGNAVTLTASGASTYTWSTGVNTATASVSPTTTTVYTVTGASSGCSSAVTTTVTTTSNPTVAVSNATNCAGAAVTLTASGATTYTWSTGVNTTTASVSPTTTTVYTVTGTTSSCNNVKTVTVTTTSNPTVAVSNATNCAGAAVTLTASGATTYTWSTGVNTATASVSPTTTTVYTVTGTTSSCNNVKTVTVTTTATPTVAVSNATNCAGAVVTLTASGATTYTWSTGVNTTTASVSPTTTTVYTVTGTTSTCNDVKTVTVTTTSNPTVSVSNATNCAGAAVTLTASGATTYTWSTGINTTTASVSPTTTTVYTVTGTTSTCNDIKTVTVTTTSNPTVAVSNATNCAGAAVTLTASGATTYTWSTGVNTTTASVSPTTTTVYTVTGTTSSCNNVKTVTVTTSSIPTTTASTTGTITCSTLSVSLNSTLAGMNYTWTAPAGGSVGSANTQSTSASGGPGTYTLNVQSGAGCSYSTTTTVAQNIAAPTVTANTTGILTCAASSSVALNSATTPGTATVNWTGVGVCGTATSFTTSACSAGIYTVTATDPTNQCTKTGTVQVLPSAGSPSVTANPVTNSITCTNTLVTVGVSTAVSPVTYSWSGVGISGTTTLSAISVTQGGAFTYTVTDTNNSCTTVGTQSVTQNTAIPTTAASTTGSLTCASLSVSLNSTLAGMQYTWTAPSGGSVGSANTQTTTASGVAGTYTLLVVDPNNDCAYTTTTSVTQDITQPVTIASTTGTLTCVTNSVDLTSTLAGMQYTWTAPSGGSVASANTQSTTASGAIGDYTLTVKDPGNGCTYTVATTVTDNKVTPTGLSAGSDQTMTCSSSSIALTGSISTPGNANLVWTGPSVCGTSTLLTTDACAAGAYTLTATDPSNGCIATSIVNVSPNAGAPVPSISSSTLVLDCNNTVQSATVTSLPSTDVTYSWNIAPATVSPDNSVATFTNANTYICTVTNTISSCSATVQVVVSQDITQPVTIASTTGTLTCVTNSVDLTSTLAGMQYTWTAPSGGSVASANTQSTTASGAIGDYTLTVKDPGNGCTYTVATTVTDNKVTPTGLSAGSDQTMTCSSSSIALTGSISTPGNANLVWTGPSVCGTSTLLTTDACAAGAYTLTATDPSNGCIATSIVNVSPNAGAPVPSISSSTLVLDCNNTVQSATVTSLPSTDVTYSWNIAPATVSPDNSVATFTNANTYICTVTNTISSCSAAVQVTVSANNTAPTIAISPTQTLTCTFPNAVISTTVNPAVTYTWTGTLVSGQSTGAVTVNQAGDYSVTVTAANGCTNTASVHVDSDKNLPSASVAPVGTNSTITCFNTLVTLSVSVVSSGASYSYTWAPPVNNTTSLNVLSSGVYSVTVKNNTTGCLTTIPYTVLGNLTTPTVSASNAVIPCGSSSVQITATSTATNANYTWTTAGSGIITGSTVSTPTVNSVGQYVVTVLDNTSGCVGTGTVVVSQNAITTSISADPTSGTAPLNVGFTNTSTGASSFAWNFGDSNNNTSTSGTPGHIYNTPGTYTVLLVASNGSCTATSTITIEVFENAVLILPNVFTPNGDGANDVFKVIGTGIKEFNCDIFNRWGLKIKTLSSVNDSWDGSSSADGTYYYILKASAYDGTEYNKQGYINLFR